MKTTYKSHPSKSAYGHRATVVFLGFMKNCRGNTQKIYAARCSCGWESIRSNQAEDGSPRMSDAEWDLDAHIHHVKSLRRPPAAGYWY